MTAPTSGTYRIQVTPQHTLRDVAADVDYLARLGISHLYLSPLLTSVPGSTHGYDVIDHASIDAELGGLPALLDLHRLAGERGMGMVLDVVPNHMAMPVPEYLNEALWSVLKEGGDSPFASWFDVDWSAHRSLLLPVLGARIDECLDAEQVTVVLDGPTGEPAVRYQDHVFPVRAGTELLAVEDLLDAQHYRLAYWRLADEELNYRRFFDVDTLVGLRVEDPDVFATTHDLIATLVRNGVISGLRIDHPDGLADPRAYLERLAGLTEGAWVVVEKILEGDESLPADWQCAGTTGYEAAARIAAVFVDPSAEVVLTQAFVEAINDDRPWAAVAQDARREILAGSLATEVERLTALAYDICQEHLRLRDHSRRGITEALIEMLATVPVYRVYVRAGQEADDAAVSILTDVAAACARAIPDREADARLIRDLALGRHGRSPLKDQFISRFQQTCGPAMAKGVEDTAFYRWFPLTSLAEVGASPDQFVIHDDAIHGWARARACTWPHALNATSTHDTKRSEDVRARVSAISEIPGEWLATTRAWTTRAGAFTPPGGDIDASMEWLLWQTIVGAWPIDGDRLTAYLVKAAREAKLRTSWTAPDETYESALAAHVTSILADDAITASIAQTVERLSRAFTTNVLGQRALQLVLPGVPDIYQGCEVVNLRLADPDNRVRPDPRRLRDALDRGTPDVDPWTDLDAAKARLTAVGLRLRRERPSLNEPRDDYVPVLAEGPAAAHSFGFTRADLCTLVTRRTLRLDASGGWQDTRLLVAEGRWTDALTGQAHVSTGALDAASVHSRWPATILVRLER